MQKIIIAVTGASGSIYAELLLRALTEAGYDESAVALVLSDNARVVWQHERQNTSYETFSVARYDTRNFHAPFASGSSRYEAMCIIPCSMGTLARIATGVSSDLITRAADVMLKERRRLICVPREMPYNLMHVRNMEQLLLAGAIICPASPHFYAHPTNVEALARTVVDRVLDLLDVQRVSGEGVARWGN